MTKQICHIFLSFWREKLFLNIFGIVYCHINLFNHFYISIYFFRIHTLLQLLLLGLEIGNSSTIKGYKTLRSFILKSVGTVYIGSPPKYHVHMRKVFKAGNKRCVTTENVGMAFQIKSILLCILTSHRDIQTLTVRFSWSNLNDLL